MKKWNRRGLILDVLKSHEEVSVEDLTVRFNASPSTIRRDLAALEKEEMVVRTHGGVKIHEGFTALLKPFDERLSLLKKEKNAIAEMVCSKLEPGSKILLNGSTTNYHVAKKLSQKSKYIICTNSLKIASLLGSNDKNDVILAGGDYRARNHDSIGRKTIEFIESMLFDYAIIGTDLIVPGKGFYDHSCHCADIGLAMGKSARKLYIVADHSKFYSQAAFKVAEPENVDTLFIDDDLPENIKASLSQEPYAVIYC